MLAVAYKSSGQLLPRVSEEGHSDHLQSCSTQTLVDEKGYHTLYTLKLNIRIPGLQDKADITRTQRNTTLNAKNAESSLLQPLMSSVLIS